MNVAFRVDASPQIGTGHFTRCQTLAAALIAEGGDVRFISRSAPPHLQDSVRAIGAEMVTLECETAPADSGLPHAQWLGTSQAADAAATSRALSDRSWNWLVVDHYAIDATWERAMRGCATRIAVIDDLADRVHDCDVLVDPNLADAGASRYDGKVPSHCPRLVGPDYALLRPEFARLRQLAVVRDGAVRRVLVFFGGVDASNLTVRAVEALAGMEAPLIVDVVIGATNPHRAEVERLVARHAYTLHVQTGDMPQLAGAADLAIGTGGVALWERCCVGLPTITFATATNHVEQVDSAARAGIVYGATDSSADTMRLHTRAVIDNAALRHAISSRAMQLVDGSGASRVVQRLRSAEVTVRPAIAADAGRVRDWRNHDSVRSMSRHAEPIPADQHADWFARVRQNPATPLLIGELDGEPVGVVRFDIARECAEVSIYVAPDRQGSGIGPAMLAAAERWLRGVQPAVTTLVADVLAGNERSDRLFLRGGYSRDFTRYIKRVKAS